MSPSKGDSRGEGPYAGAVGALWAGKLDFRVPTRLCPQVTFNEKRGMVPEQCTGCWPQRGLLNAVSSCRPRWQTLLRQDALSRAAPVPRVVPLQGCADSWARSKLQACKVPGAEGAAENPAMTEQAGPWGQAHSEVWAQVATHKTEVTRQILNSRRLQTLLFQRFACDGR